MPGSMRSLTTFVKCTRFPSYFLYVILTLNGISSIGLMPAMTRLLLLVGFISSSLGATLSMCVKLTLLFPHNTKAVSDLFGKSTRMEMDDLVVLLHRFRSLKLVTYRFPRRWSNVRNIIKLSIRLRIPDYRNARSIDSCSIRLTTVTILSSFIVSCREWKFQPR